jgi:hypothetical protein
MHGEKVRIILLCFVIPLKTVACQPLLFSIYVIGLYLEEQIKKSHFLHDLKILSESPKTSKYVVMVPSHNGTLNTAIQYFILQMSLSVALLPCHQMWCQQRQFVTPQFEFSPRKIHMGFQMDTVTFGQVFLRALRVVPCQLSFHLYSTFIHLSLVDGQWAHYGPHFRRVSPHHTKLKEQSPCWRFKQSVGFH